MTDDTEHIKKALQVLESHVDDFSEFKEKVNTYHQRGLKAMDKVDALYAGQIQAAKYLANLEALPQIAEKFQSIKAELLPAAMAQNHVPVNTMNEALKSQAKTYLILIKSLLWTVGILITVFVGIKYVVPDFFK